MDRTVGLLWAPLLATVVLLMTGCVSNRLLRLETGDFVKSAGESTNQAKQFYFDWIRSDEQTWQAMYAVDARCVPPSLRTKGATKAGEDEPLCTKLRAELTSDSFELELESIDFVASYVAALAKAAADPKLTYPGTFDQARKDFNNVHRALNLSQEKPEISDDKAKAAKEFLTFIETISKDAESAEKIRSEFKTKGPDAQAKLDMLAQVLLDDAKLVKLEGSVRKEKLAEGIHGGPSDGVVRKDLLVAYQATRTTEFANKRRADACRESPEIKKDEKLEQYCDAPAAGLVHAAAKAHHDLGELIAGNPTDKQRARRAKLAYRQFMDFIGALVGLVTNY